MVKIHNDWDVFLADEFQKEYYVNLRNFLKSEYVSRKIYPDMYSIFNALKYTSYSDVKIVILGQDPYHGANQAHGLAFSVSEYTQVPPSLVNIFKELKSDIGSPANRSGCLIPWAKQGVLLLNSVLTVRAGQAFSHRNKGWELFTNRIIEILNERERPIIFLLWGKASINKKRLINEQKHYILTAAHPSPLSANNGFFGCKHFSKSNNILKKMQIKPICWST